MVPVTDAGEEIERELVALAHEFAEKEIRPAAAQYDESEEFPWDIYYKAAEVGLTCYDLPDKYGGGGTESVLTECKIYEEMAWGDSPIACAIETAAFAARLIVASGSEEQCERWVAPFCTAKPPVGAFCLTEPGCGSDAAALKTHAKRVDGGYALNGSKTWITNGPEADVFLTFATVAPGTRAKGITCFVVERGDDGITVGRKLPKMGARCSRASEVFFEDCFVPEDRRIGEEGKGFVALTEFFQWSRTTQGAHGVGIGRAALEYAIEYAKEREAFGKKIHEFEAVSFRLVDAKLKLDQARLMVHHAARLADAGKDVTAESSMAKIAGSEAAWEATYAAMQTLASYGYSREYPVEKWLRDAKLEDIYEGTSDIQRLIVARTMFRG